MDQIPDTDAMTPAEQAKLYDDLMSSYTSSPRSNRYRDPMTGAPLSRAERRRRKIREPLPIQERILRDSEAQAVTIAEVDLSDVVEVSEHAQ